MKHIKRAALAVAVMMAAACSGGDADEAISQAEAEIAAGNAANARICCSVVADTTMTLTPSMLCRAAVVYAQLAEIDDNSEDMAMAAKCFERAVNLNADSVQAYMDHLDVAALSRAQMLRELTMTMAVEADSLEDLADEHDEQAIQPN